MEGRALRRNAPSLYNVVFKTYLFHDGRETDLGAQVWGPLLAADEMGNPAIGPLLTRLAQDKDYGPAFDAAFPGEGVTMVTLGRAIAAYEATLAQRRQSVRPRALWRRPRGAHRAGMARIRDLRLERRLHRLPHDRRDERASHRSVLARHGRRLSAPKQGDDPRRIGAGGDDRRAPRGRRVPIREATSAVSRSPRIPRIAGPSRRRRCAA